MKDRYIIYSDGRRVFVKDLSDAELLESIAMLKELEPMDGTDATHATMQERLAIEKHIRGLP